MDACRQWSPEEEEWLADSSIWRSRETGSQQHLEKDGWLTDSRFVEKVRLLADNSKGRKKGWLIDSNR